MGVKLEQNRRTSTMAKNTITLEGADKELVTTLYNKNQGLIQNHSRVRTEFLTLEMRIIQERSNVENEVRTFIQRLAGEEAEILGFNIDAEAGTVSIETADAETTETTEAVDGNVIEDSVEETTEE